ncbi:MAG: hypothetical protein JW855_02865 [Gammaproteobacteria bacterium]|nr:hypothetical protein [Gammaproteobacteria bacterium]
MKRIIFYLLILTIAILMGLTIASHSSYVLISYGDWTIKSPLWLTVAGIAVIFLILHYAIRLLLGIENTYDRWQYWRQARKINTANCFTKKGFWELIQNDWKLSESYFIKAAEYSQIAVIPYLLAAFCADRQEAYDRRDYYIAKARITEPESEAFIELFLAQLQIKGDQLNLVRPRLEYLYHIRPKNKFVLILLKSVYERLEEWGKLLALLPQIQKLKLLSADEFVQFETSIYRHVFQKETDPEQLKCIRQKMPRRVKKLL